EALRRDVDLEVVGAVLGTVVQVDGEVLGHGSGLPGAHRVEGVVTATFGVTTAAKGSVRDLPLVITVDVLPVETVPVPHGVRVVLPCLPAHGVDLFHVRVLVVIAPPVPATVVACGGVDHGTVRGGGRGERGQSEQRDGHKNECAGDPARDSGCGVLRLHCVLRCSQPGRLSNGSAPRRVDYPWKAESNHTRGKEARTARVVTAMTSKGPKRHRPSGSGEAIGVGSVAVGKPVLITERSIIR